MSKKEHYSNLKMALRLLTLAIAILALVMSISNRSEIKWQEKVQDNIIESVLFPKS
jgi:hypothetical protein